MKIVIAGYGPVGQSIEHVLRQHAGVDLYIDDPYKGANFPSDQAHTVDGVIVCVATQHLRAERAIPLTLQTFLKNMAIPSI